MKLLVDVQIRLARDPPPARREAEQETGERKTRGGEVLGVRGWLVIEIEIQENRVVNRPQLGVVIPKGERMYSAHLTHSDRTLISEIRSIDEIAVARLGNTGYIEV